MKRLALIVMLVVFPFSAIPQSKAVIVAPSGFLTGQTFLDLNASERLYAVTGVIDGFLASPMLGAPLPNVTKFKDCIAGRNNGQLVAMVEKYLRDRPQDWHGSFAPLTFGAMKVGCE